MSTKNVKSSVHNANNTSSSKLNSSKVTAPITSQSVTETETTAGNVNIPLIRSKDLAKQLPVFTAALQRAPDDALAAENLDSIQLELEKLLSNVALRYRVLKGEYDSLDRDEKRNERRAKQAQSNIEKAPKSPDSVAASSSNAAAMGKRKREESTSNTSMQRKSKHGSSFTHKHAKYGKSSSSLSQTNEDSMDYASNTAGAQTAREMTVPKLALPKNDVPNKFWLSIEPYCMPLTNEDLRLIDELLEQYSGALVPPIPDLGPHYSDVWAQEDLKELQQSGNPHNQRSRTQNNNAAALLKKAESLMDDCVTGPLTQRLVTALMEEQLLPSTTTTGSNENQSNNVKPEAHIGTPLRSLSMLRNCIGIEQRIKKELVEQGILDVTDLGPNGDEDEISNEIKRLITELTAIADYNSVALKRLRASAVEEIKRLEIKRKLDTIDQEIMEAYKRSMQNKAKRKPLTAEEQQEIFRLTAEQKKLSDQLERAQVKSFLYE